MCVIRFNMDQILHVHRWYKHALECIRYITYICNVMYETIIWALKMSDSTSWSSVRHRPLMSSSRPVRPLKGNGSLDC